MECIAYGWSTPYESSGGDCFAASFTCDRQCGQVHVGNKRNHRFVGPTVRVSRSVYRRFLIEAPAGLTGALSNLFPVPEFGGFARSFTAAELNALAIGIKNQEPGLVGIPT